LVRRSTFSEANQRRSTFDKGYVDYAQYEAFSRSSIWYVTRLKYNTIYQPGEEFDIPDNAHSDILKDKEIKLYYGDKKKEEHRDQ
jgi:hypothetical protein